MLLKISCDYCGCEQLESTNCNTTFYCPCCDDEISIYECGIIEVINDTPGEEIREE